ncbi:hypothetical protein HT118_20795 [Escherichia coli]|nr:hypothetical protein [Escherichia coli]
MKSKIGEQEYFDKGVLMIAMVKAGVELAFETMVDSGIIGRVCFTMNHCTSFH